MSSNGMQISFEVFEEPELNRYTYFKKPTAKQIRKKYPIKVDIGMDTTPEELSLIVRYIDKYEHIQLRKEYRSKIVPEDWEEIVKEKLERRSKKGKNVEIGEIYGGDLIAHGPPWLLNLYNEYIEDLPENLFFKRIKHMNEPHAQFGWIDDDKKFRGYQLVDVFKAYDLYKGILKFKERIETKGTCEEVECFVPSAGVEERTFYEVGITNLPLWGDKNKFHKWVNTNFRCKCRKVDQGFFHYTPAGICQHVISAYWKALEDYHKIEGNDKIAFNMFPIPTEIGLTQWKNLDRVVIGNRTLPLYMRGILIEHDGIFRGFDKIFTFDVGELNGSYGNFSRK